MVITWSSPGQIRSKGRQQEWCQQKEGRQGQRPRWKTTIVKNTNSKQCQIKKYIGQKQIT